MLRFLKPRTLCAIGLALALFAISALVRGRESRLERDILPVRPITPPDCIAPLCTALGIDTDQEFDAAGARPMPIVDRAAKPIAELLR